MTQSDRRSQTRRHLVYYLEIYEIPDGPLLGHLADITVEGLMLVSENPFEVGRTCMMELRFPREMLGHQRLILRANCRWCKRDLNPDLWVAGFLFERIPDDGAALIYQLIKDFGFHE